MRENIIIIIQRTTARHREKEREKKNPILINIRLFNHTTRKGCPSISRYFEKKKFIFNLIRNQHLDLENS